ncbi:hypothetical protein GCM10022213_20200 [Parerythrobacter jejuensis]
MQSIEELALALLVMAMAFIMGFAIRRGSICLVEASMLLVVKRRSLRLRAFAIALGAAGLVIIPLAWLIPGTVMLYPTWGVTGQLVAAAALFALGARINGGCAFGTLSRLSVGNLSYGATLVGAVGGATLIDPASEPSAATSQLGTPGWPGIAAIVLFLVLIWPALKMATLGNLHAALTRRETLLRPTAAMLVIGLVGGALFALAQSWTYLSVLAAESRYWAGHASEKEGLRAVVGCCALLAGALFAAHRSGRFRLRWPSAAGLARHGLGGVIMGSAAASIPGSNGVLLLFGIPSGSVSAFVAYAVMSVVLMASFVPARIRQAQSRQDRSRS